MKAVLVINRMPNTCNECEYCGYAIVGEGEDEYKYRSCCLSQKYLGEIAEDIKDSLCPLKPLPKEKDIYEVGMDEEDTNAKRQWNKGWNACLKEIAGE